MGGALSGCCGVEEEPHYDLQSRRAKKTPHFAREEAPAQPIGETSTKTYQQKAESDASRLKREKIQQATEERLKKMENRGIKGDGGQLAKKLEDQQSEPDKTKTTHLPGDTSLKVILPI